MQKLSAEIIYPQSSPPVKNGILLLEDDGTVIDLVDPTKLDYIIEEVDVLNGFLCPGFVNTHSHLELSYMYQQIPEKMGIKNFVDEVEKNKKKFSLDEKLIAIENALAKLKEDGIVAVGDIVNTDDTFQLKQNSAIYFHHFIEVYSSNPAVADERFNYAKQLWKLSHKDFLSSIVPHAPYSVSPKLFSYIKQFCLDHPKSPVSIHFAESNQENELFMYGKGPLTDMYKNIGTPLETFAPFGRTSWDYLNEQLLPIEQNLILVHNTYLTPQPPLQLGRGSDFPSNNIFFCLCPNSNLFIEDALPDIPLLMTLSDNICLGTDSLASNHTLSIKEEIKTIQKYFPTISLETILKWATLNGAKALGIENKFGSFEKGKRPGVVNLEMRDER